MKINKIVLLSIIIVLLGSIGLNVFLYWFVPFPWKHYELMKKSSPNNDRTIRVIEKYTIDPPNQIIYLHNNHSMEILAHLEEDKDWVETITWLSDDEVEIITDKYNFNYSIITKTLKRREK